MNITKRENPPRVLFEFLVAFGVGSAASTAAPPAVAGPLAAVPHRRPVSLPPYGFFEPATAAAADRHVQPLPGTDVALMLGMMNVLIRDDLLFELSSLTH